MTGLDDKEVSPETLLAEVQQQLFDTQFRLGCVERLYPGLAERAYQRACRRIAKSAEIKPHPWLCRHGWHFWQKKSGIRHHHVECRRCHTREIWPDASLIGGYQPVDLTWGPIRNK